MGPAPVSAPPMPMARVGADALRAYLDAALRRTRGIRYALQKTYAGIDSVVLVYACGFPNRAQKPGADLMRVDRDRMVVEWRCHY